MKKRLSISGFKVLCRLGWYEEERTSLQPVVFDVSIELPPNTVVSNLTDTVNYESVCGVILQTMKEREHHLIEEAAQQVFEAIKVVCGEDKIVSLTLTKTNVPINNLTSTQYTIQD